jgi:hypothetical protein
MSTTISDKPDLSHIRLLIATPADGHNLDMFYVSSLSQTVQMIRECGGYADWGVSPGCADLPMARAKLFGKFYRSDFTHMLCVDSDMGFDPNDVLKLILADREYIGATGCKKEYPLKFCANYCSEDGEPYKVEVEIDKGIIKCTEVGAAFMLMSKSCAVKMVEAYKDTLGWETGKDENGQPTFEYAVYDPMVFTTPKGKRIRWAEDFSFCKRWRAIGGLIYLMPEIELKHTGSHTWSGKLSDTFIQQARYGQLIGQGVMKEGDTVNDPSTPFFDPSRPASFPGQAQIIPRESDVDTVILTRVGGMPMNIEESEAAE